MRQDIARGIAHFTNRLRGLEILAHQRGYLPQVLCDFVRQIAARVKRLVDFTDRAFALCVDVLPQFGDLRITGGQLL